MENTIKNKAKFFAQYWDQNVMRCKTFNTTIGSGLSGLMNVDINSETIKDNWFLALKPLSQISDEDAIEVARIIGYSSSDIETINYLNNQVKTITSEKGIFYFLNMYKIDALICYKVFQFLGSKGYYIGDGTEIEYGWVKLKEVK